MVPLAFYPKDSMGPTNNALVKLYQADQQLREAQSRLDSVTRNVRLQEKKVLDLTAREAAAKTELTRLKAHGAELDLENKSREEKIEKLREQQTQAQTNKEYQAFLVQINTLKVDKTKVEEEQLATMEKVEKLTTESESLAAQKTNESGKLGTMKGSIDSQVKELTSEIDNLRPAREEAANAVPLKALDTFNRLGERYEGESLEAIDKPHPKREEYIATICNIDLTVDVYNRLHSRDDLVFCPGCGRILYIPADLTPEKAVHKPKAKKERKAKASELAAPVPLQTLATSVVSSVDEDEPEEPVQHISVPQPAENNNG